MAEIMTKEKKNKKLGIKQDELGVENLLNQARKVQENQKKLMPNQDKGEILGYPRQKMIKGRPYFYLVWYIKDAYGQRRQRSRYLGTALPKGYSLGKPVKIGESDETMP